MDDRPAKRSPRPRYPADQEDHQPDMHALRTPLTVAMLRAQILRRRLRRGDTLPSLEAELDQIDATLIQVAVAIDQLDRDGRRG